MTAKTFITDLWYEDLEILPPVQRRLATDVLLYSSFELHCRPYHRASKCASASDRQTILLHPRTGLACFVISVVPDEDGYVLRVDFRDKNEAVGIPFADVLRAPRTQWEKKGERRFLVPSSVSTDALREAVRRIVALENRE